ncbi:class I SAM-dependent methyltransferase [Mesorhizobium sp. WSM4303]|uniref:class I SAM-dependent DNA methyltransferase n=1 Tax=unclassified Mesorhizobium TaxID=325217 RepID=UPI00115D27EC|nr:MULTISPECIES: class I SAM-dependent methyltransferase [unclassified Mesorhizobium]TRC85945.1 class I SAM-dependent methyltransferase [Mesorhizobium sp. WSM4306]TRC94935.1 class I SAM-dependent methyltransferase [Mesorhizobium sp. WSM4303]
MEGFRPEDSFRGDVARRYDDELRGDEGETVLFLQEIAAGRDCLEFAVGTGRIALPLAATGLRVDGIELSPDMIDMLKAKPGGSQIEVVNGDMTAVEIGRRYGLVYLVFNSIGNVITQDGQVKCFENAARHLDEDGVFLLECRVPTAPKQADSGFVEISHPVTGSVHIAACRYDPVSQVLDLSHIDIGNDSVRMVPLRLRLANPPEFDLMARCAGLQIDQRYGGWKREPFDARSWRHISIYRKR